MDFSLLFDNFTNPPVLFFYLGLFAVWVNSDLEIPAPIARFLTLYLLFHIGFKGGTELSHGGLDGQMFITMAVCMAGSFLMPLVSFPILKRKLNVYDAGAVAAAYGSISAVTFATATSLLDNSGIPFGGYMVAAMALMEGPAIISGLMLMRREAAKQPTEGEGIRKQSWKDLLHESFFNGSVLLLLGSLAIGIISGTRGATDLKPFVTDIFKGLLCLYMLDMGLLAGKRIKTINTSRSFLLGFGIGYPLVGGAVGLALSALLGLDHGNALLMTVLFASASYIAVPAAIRLAVPEANMGLLVPLTLGVTFTFNISLGIPLFNTLIGWLWAK